MNPQARKNTLRMLSNGIYIMTARSGERYGGATVTWVSQSSFHPPIVMAAVRKESNVYRCTVESGTAAIHIVGSDQQHIAQRFFCPTTVEGDRINGEPFHLSAMSIPILNNLPAYIECEVREVLDGVGDHAVMLLEVVEAECRNGVCPLTVAGSPWTYGG
jgi:flavin reductase (DIM6/NTAB) family NADH-FMN oxidoreductase RutF